MTAPGPPRSLAAPCLLFALRWEARSFLRSFRPGPPLPGAPRPARFCGPAGRRVLVVETGIGPARMEEALTWVLGRPVLDGEPYLPPLVVSAGFSGALRDDYQVGDVIVATEVVDAEGHSWPTTWPGPLPAGELPLHRDRLLSVSRLAATPEDKRTLGQGHSAAAVDMETAVVARVCSRHGISFGCVRAISDALSTPLPPRLLALVQGSRVKPVHLMLQLARRPVLVRGLWRLARDSRIAAERLGEALGMLLTSRVNR